MAAEGKKGITERLTEACIIKSMEGALIRKENKLALDQKLDKSQKVCPGSWSLRDTKIKERAFLLHSL